MHSDKLVSVLVCVLCVCVLCTTKVSKRNTHKQISKDCGEAINNMIYALHKLFTFIFMHFVVVAHMHKPVCVSVCVCVRGCYICICMFLPDSKVFACVRLLYSVSVRVCVCV